MLRATIALSVLPLVVSTWGLRTAAAQRPFFANDPLYRDETARRTYDHGYALSGELSYRAVEAASREGTGSLGVLMRVEYQIASRFDIAAVLDVYSQLEAQAMRIAWIYARHQWHSEGADMAVRLALEPRPAVGGGFGFRQTDLGFFYSKVLSASVETEMALGIRHVQSAGQPGPTLAELDETSGLEAHIQLGYNMVFDPARSHVSVALAYEAGRYDVIDRARPPEVNDADTVTEFTGHVLWLRTGLHWYRPSYQLVPFVSVPIVAGSHGEGFVQGEGPRYLNIGVRVTLR